MVRIDRFDSSSYLVPFGRNNISIFCIDTIFQLLQFIGYAKYKNRKVGNVYFRGQSSLYDFQLRPTLFRGINNFQKVKTKFYKEIKAITKSLGIKDSEITAALLQHYGIKTDWLDVVDNIWIALWFASHRFNCKKIGENVFCEVEQHSDLNYSYIILLLSDVEGNKDKVLSGKETLLVDLRTAVSSVYLRPHIQHAYSFKKKNDFDYSDTIVAIAKIKNSNVFNWLGNGFLTTPNALIPSPLVDVGYKKLLKIFSLYKKNMKYGSITIF